MKFERMLYSLVFVSLVSIFVSCSDEDGGTDQESEGTAVIELTDSPVDDPNVSAAFVTVSEVKIDGQTVEGFNKTTVDLLAYQNGSTKVLAEAMTEAKSYSDITLVLDGQTDVSGNAPGCYVLTTDGTKHALINATKQVKVDYDFEVEENQRQNFVVDFDLRKAIKRTGNTNDMYDFVSDSELRAALRVTNKTEANTITGTCGNLSFQSMDKIVVYAYKKGTYNRSTEVSAQGSSQLRFKNAVSSAALDASGDFELHFLEDGEYELQFAAYEADSKGEMKLKGTLIIDVLSGIDLAAIDLSTSSTVSLNLLATGILPI